MGKSESLEEMWGKIHNRMMGQLLEAAANYMTEKKCRVAARQLHREARNLYPEMDADLARAEERFEAWASAQEV